MKRTINSVSVRVRCSGSLHKISLTEDGAIVLHDHNLRSERALVALGGEPCRCLQVLEAWRKHDRQALPAGLRPALDEAQSIRAKRSTIKRFDTPSLPLIDRAKARVRHLATSALKSCLYRQSESTWAGGNHTDSVYIGEPTISGSSDRVWSQNGKWSGSDSQIIASVPLSWFSRVYRRGLAVVEGCFILDVISEDEKGYTVLAGKQGRGFNVNPHRARIRKDGQYQLTWLKGEV